LTPLFIRIPPQSPLQVRAAFFPIDPVRPAYEVRLFFFNPVNLVVNSWGVSISDVPQEGNTVLHHNFWTVDPIRLFQLPTPSPFIG
jgi:hypothetical protein